MRYKKYLRARWNPIYQLWMHFLASLPRILALEKKNAVKKVKKKSFVCHVASGQMKEYFIEGESAKNEIFQFDPSL